RTHVGKRMPDFTVYGLTPPSRDPDPTIAIAAARAGGTGLLDLTLAKAHPERAVATVRRLASEARGRWGLRCTGSDLTGAHTMIAGLGADTPGTVVITIEDRSLLHEQV